MAGERAHDRRGMKLLADVHISPRTAEFLRTLGHDVVRVPEVLPASAADEVIIEHARRHEQVIITQDLDFSASWPSAASPRRRFCRCGLPRPESSMSMKSCNASSRTWNRFSMQEPSSASRITAFASAICRSASKSVGCQSPSMRLVSARTHVPSRLLFRPRKCPAKAS
jgi:hypothetical protein